MVVADIDSEYGDFSLKKVQVFNWFVLLAMVGAGWLAMSVFVAGSIFIGGTVANLSFVFLKNDLTRLLSGPMQAVKVRFFMKYYVRLSLVVVMLFLLVKYQFVHTVGLLIGLSTVLLSIAITVVGEVKKIYFNIKEAS